MSDETKFLKWPIPSENKDPHFSDLEELYGRIDDAVYGVMTSSNIIIPAGNIVWNAGMSLLTWTGYFEVPLLVSPFSLRVQFGPDGINKQATILDGQRLAIYVPRSLSANLDANFSVVSQFNTVQSGLLVVAMRRGNNLYLNLPQVL